MAAVYEIEAGYAYGTQADSWADLAEALAEWVERPLSYDDFEEQGRSFAARAVLLAGGETVRPHRA